ncbi:alpha/beta fold hydrolase [Ectobacillus ponti]|uniref:Alpha/beta fold hydrolase n=1 Tax=Ectobacillus ponti TaxID=2961894 RepID=A0AA41XDR9_9BACI|nr:alpha/beta fold hydrolase [Ectobacillus ponti]MCP8971055.1 alpha/beta fold hydrolase [Ectobacillus ponti]
MLAILVHGFYKSGADMQPLARQLEQLGYTCLAPDLPLTYQEFVHAAGELEVLLANLREPVIHLVGHSTGGLVIRKLLHNTKHADRIGRCVLIATPNQGSRLADTAAKIGPYIRTYKTLQSLRPGYVAEQGLQNPHGIDIAAIAGNRSDLLLGRLLIGENDGRVEVGSVPFSGLSAFIKLPYHHKDIHHQPETARLTDAFLRTGRFSG